MTPHLASSLAVAEAVADVVPEPLDPATVLTQRRHGLLVLAAGLLGTRPAAEDVVQDVFEAVLRRGIEFTSAAQATAYLRTAVVNRCRSVFRRRAVQWRYEAAQRKEHPLVHPAADEFGTHAELVDALHKLPPRQRMVIVLRFWSDLPFNEIAEMTGMRPGTARMLASRALSNLEKVLKENNDA